VWLVDRLHLLPLVVVVVGRLRESNSELSIHRGSHLERVVVIFKHHFKDLVDRERVNGVKNVENLPNACTTVSPQYPSRGT
jgi:hypothetical protein